MKLVLGLIGPQLAGKETCAAKLEELVRRDGHTVSRHRFSDILRDTLDLWGIPHGRSNEQLLAQIMQRPGDGFPPGVLSRAMKHRLLQNPADVGILDGARWYSDEEMLREFPKAGVKSLIIYITASEDRRFERLQARNRAGEASLTREEFAKRNQAENEIYIPEIGGRADVKLVNDYKDVTSFEKDVAAAYEKTIRSLLED